MQASSSPVAVPGFCITNLTVPLSEARPPPIVTELPGIPTVYEASSANDLQL
jgi:hypothetical protein